MVDADADAGASKALDRAITAARDLLLTAAPDRPLAVVGGRHLRNPVRRRVELAPTIAGWESLAFGQELRAAFPGAPSGWPLT